MQVDLLDYTKNGDLQVCNAARCSFGKMKEVLDESDKKLIKYLANNGHFTPFTHVFVSFRICAPIFVCRQLMKHTVGLTVNEESRRYISTEPKFYSPPEWRAKSASVKQGSDPNKKVKLDFDIDEYHKNCLDTYNKLLESGVAPEQARMVLPLSSLTTFWWSGSLSSFARVCNLRIEASAQEETKQIALMISEHCNKLFPVSWKVLMKVDGWNKKE